MENKYQNYENVHVENDENVSSGQSENDKNPVEFVDDFDTQKILEKLEKAHKVFAKKQKTFEQKEATFKKQKLKFNEDKNNWEDQLLKSKVELFEQGLSAEGVAKFIDNIIENGSDD